jgi:xanthine dehydrogenase accessory factor
MKKADGSWDKFDDYVIDFALETTRMGHRLSLVTLVEIDGSSPRQLGAQMAVSEHGDWVGYLSGGCIERAVVAEAIAAIEQNEGRRVRYGKGSKYLDIQLPCGSAIELSFDVDLTRSEFEKVDESLRKRKSACLEIQRFSNTFDTPMIRRYRPRRRLIVFGVGPAPVQLARLGQLSGFEVHIYSPDQTTIATACDDNLSAIAINGANAIPAFEADERTAIAFMFHDHEWERRLIPAALRTSAFYIGAMGSRRTHQQRLRTLVSLGIDETLLDRIRGPAGLFSSAKNSREIAASILAEIMQVDRCSNSKDLFHPAFDFREGHCDVALRP